MEGAQGTRTTLITAFLQGGAVVAIILWSVLSFAPLVAIVYGDLSISQTIVNGIFAATGILTVAALYALWLLVASPEARLRLAPDGRKVLHRLGVFAAGWTVLYTFLAWRVSRLTRLRSGSAIAD